MTRSIVSIVCGILAVLVISGSGCDVQNQHAPYHCDVHCISNSGEPFDSFTTVDTTASSQSNAEDSCVETFNGDHPEAGDPCPGGSLDNCTCEPTTAKPSLMDALLPPGILSASDAAADDGSGCQH